MPVPDGRCVPLQAGAPSSFRRYGPKPRLGQPPPTRDPYMALSRSFLPSLSIGLRPTPALSFSRAACVATCSFIATAIRASSCAISRSASSVIRFATSGGSNAAMRVSGAVAVRQTVHEWSAPRVAARARRGRRQAHLIAFRPLVMQHRRSGLIDATRRFQQPAGLGFIRLHFLNGKIDLRIEIVPRLPREARRT